MAPTGAQREATEASLVQAAVPNERAHQAARTTTQPAPSIAPLALEHVTEVFVLATGHSFHLKSAFGYTLTDLHDQIVALAPDVVCGEIVAADHGKTEWMYPLEVAVVEHAAHRAGAAFVAADWRPHGFADQTDLACAAMSPAEKHLYDHAYDRFMPRFEAAFGEGLFEFFHSPEALALIEEVHARMILAATDVGAGFWDTRNQLIVKNCMRQAEKGSARRVVFAFGGDHKYGIEKDLARFYGLTAGRVRRLFEHRNDEVAPEVVARWIRQRDLLVASKKNGSIPPSLASSYPLDRIAAAWSKAIQSRGKAE